MHDLIRTRQQTVDEYLEDPTIPQEVKVSVIQRLREITGELLAVTDSDARERHLREYIKGEHRRAQANSVEELPDGQAPREEPLCECDSIGCPLSAPRKGNLPTKVKTAPSIMVGIDRYLESHQWPTVLMEARDELRGMEATVADTLLECKIALVHETPIPDLPDDAAESSPAELSAD